ncbi:MAG: polyribonucleotide nucleotidyltransferase [Chloroflexota bacterium]|nr:polyribonucleotide nucleotidyltransferase [Chloroflexota bacterium]
MASVFEHSVAGRMLTIETGKVARQADGAVLVRYGDTMVLVTVCAGRESAGGMDFIPLTVDYEERLYAAGRIPGSFMRREGRPGQDAIITCRLIDRCLRPLLSKGFNHEIQVIATVLSADKENGPDECALIGASAAVSISDIPFAGPISAVRVGYMDGSMVLNPTLPQVEDSLFNMVVASTEQAVVMVEADANEAPEDLLLEAIKFGHEANQEIIGLQKQLQNSCGKPKVELKARELAPELLSGMSTLLGDRLSEALGQSKAEREVAVSSLEEEVKGEFEGSFAEEEIDFVFATEIKKKLRENILRKRQHVDGRQLDEVRPLSCEVGLLPRTHGSGLFTRGETQVLTVTTLGSERQEQLLDGLGLAETKRFMHHYNFTPFSTGEVRRVGTPGRREIGHGALVERAIGPILPSEEDFPYTIRLVSEVLSSSGSTSMASACGSTLSLMDAGVPIKSPVAGIAMGLVTDGNGDYVILTDIEGIEDFNGDMDFKVAGTAKGITALQLDTKLKGLDPRILGEAMSQARQARLQILDKMAQTIESSRSELSPYAPRVYEMTIDESKIGSVIGPGGKTIRSITEATKTTVDIKNDGRITIGSLSEEATQKAIKMIEDLTRDVKEGETYTGKVTRILNFGAMVEILPGKEGLVHISELAGYRVPSVEDVVKVGDEVTVKVIEIDNLGRINLSRKAVFADSSGQAEAGTKGASAPRPRWQKQSDRQHFRPPGRSTRPGNYNK